MTLASRNSSIMVTVSARSATAQRLHVSELTAMPPKKQEEVITGSIPAVPQSGVVVIETTARGEDATFFPMWKDAIEGKNRYKPHFYGWFADKTYRMKSPDKQSWKDDYVLLAKRYGLIKNIQERFKLTDSQFYWYYLQVLDYKGLVMQEFPTVWEEAFISTGSHVFSLHFPRKWP